MSPNAESVKKTDTHTSTLKEKKEKKRKGKDLVIHMTYNQYS